MKETIVYVQKNKKEQIKQTHCLFDKTLNIKVFSLNLCLSVLNRVWNIQCSSF